MFIVELAFADKSKAGRHMEGHKAWLKQGFDDGVFILAGNLQSNGGSTGGGSTGGGIVAHGLTREALEQRVSEDPFVAEGVVRPAITELTPSRADKRLDFLVEA